MYKITRPDGTDFHSGTINYAKNIGKIVRVKDYAPASAGSCAKGLHACYKPLSAFGYNAKMPCRVFDVKGIERIHYGGNKSRYRALRVNSEVSDLNKLFGFNYSEAINPIHPFKIKPSPINNEVLSLLQNWASVWASVRDSVRASVWVYTGSLFPNIQEWKYVDYKEGEYPFQTCVDLWRMGLVPSFDGTTWRLHGDKNAKVLYKIT